MVYQGQHRFDILACALPIRITGFLAKSMILATPPMAAPGLRVLPGSVREGLRQ